MEPTDIIRLVVVALAVGALLVIGLVAFGTLSYFLAHRRAKPAQTEPAPAAATARQEVHAKTLPELVAEAAEFTPDERLINAAANTLKTLSETEQAAIWVAVVPRQFNAEVLAALRPEWRARAAEIEARVQRLWFVSATPAGSCIQAVVRRAMLRHLYRKDDRRPAYQRDSLRAAKYFHARLMGSPPQPGKRKRPFASDTFYRFLPPGPLPTPPLIEWLYHLAIGDPDNAARALQQLADAWLTEGKIDPLQDMLFALREHADENRLTNALCALLYYYQGRVALRANEVRAALSALEYARRLAQKDQFLTLRIYEALSTALDIINPTDRPTLPDSSVWSALARPTADRVHWSLWADLYLPQPSLDRLRRTQETLKVYEAAHYLTGEARMLRALGEEHSARGDYGPALACYNRSYELLQQVQQQDGMRNSLRLDEALTLKGRGDAQYLMGRTSDALASYGGALQAHILLPGDDLAEADVQKSIGDVLHFLGDYTEALPRYETALATYRNAGATISEGETLLAQARLLQALRRMPEAQRCYDDALEVYRKCGSNLGLANALLVVGSSLLLQEQALIAQQNFEEALKLYRVEQNEGGEAAALKALGNASVQLKQFDQAQERYEEALLQAEVAGLRRNVAEIYLAIGHLLLRKLDNQGATQQYQTALERFKDLDDQRGEADAQLALGRVRQLRGESTLAFRLFQQAYRTYRVVRDRFGEAGVLGSMGDENLLNRDYARALSNFEAARNLWKEIGDPIGAWEMQQGRVAHTLALLGRSAEAASAYDEAAERRTAAQFGWRGWQALVLGQFEDAEVHFTAITNRDPALSWQLGLALARLGCGKFEAGSALLERTLEQANMLELDEACRWIAFVARIAPQLNLKPEDFGLNNCR